MFPALSSDAVSRLFNTKCPWQQVTGDLRRRPRNQSLTDPFGLDGACWHLRYTTISYVEISYTKRWPRGLVGMVRRYLITYNVNLLPLTNDCQQRGSTDYALDVAHNTSHILQLFPRLLRLHIGMCSRRSSNGLILPAYTRFHQSYCWTKIAPPVPPCNSPFLIHSWLLCHEHYLSF